MMPVLFSVNNKSGFFCLVGMEVGNTGANACPLSEFQAVNGYETHFQTESEI